MTREESKEVIKAYRDKLTNSVSNQLDGNIEAFDIAIKALEQTELKPSYNSVKTELDLISRQAVLEKAYKITGYKIAGYDRNAYVVDAADIAALQPVSTEKTGRWIPMTTRPMDDDEKEHFAEQLEYVDDAVIFNCPLPDDGQEVLITIYGETEIDTFIRDDVDGCYFENRDIEDVRAWMPLPQPYKAESEDKG